MKKWWIVGLIVGTLSLAGCGGSDKVYYTQTSTASTSTNGIPNKVLDEFYRMYPGAHDTSWKTEDGLYKVKFEVGDNDMNASFTPDGTMVKVNG